LRRQQVLRILRQPGGLIFGVQADIARRLQCHRSTICRDIAVLFAMPQPVRHDSTARTLPCGR